MTLCKNNLYFTLASYTVNYHPITLVFGSVLNYHELKIANHGVTATQRIGNF